jgi:hypothetical protein
MRIRISWSADEVFGELADTPSAQKLAADLPISSTASTWGEEVYFDTGIDTELEPGAMQVVDPGTICFWVEGKSLALPFGPTPISVGDECRLVTEVNILGRLESDPQILASIQSGDEIRVERVG